MTMKRKLTTTNFNISIIIIFLVARVAEIKPYRYRLVTIILSNLNRFKNLFHWKIPW